MSECGRVLEIINSHGRAVSLLAISRELGMSTVEVRHCLHRLAQERKITLRSTFRLPPPPTLRSRTYTIRGEYLPTYAPLHITPPASEQEQEYLKSLKKAKQIVDEYRKANEEAEAKK